MSPSLSNSNGYLVHRQIEVWSHPPIILVICCRVRKAQRVITLWYSHFDCEHSRAKVHYSVRHLGICQVLG